MQATKRIFITGSNRGLGKELVKIINQQHQDLQIFISSRASPQTLSQEWKTTIPNHTLSCYQIDLNDPESIKRTAQTLQTQKIEFDFIVANAAVGYDLGEAIPSEQVACSTLKTNVVATIDFVNQFLPLLASNGRVVIVSSILGGLDCQSERVRAILTDPKVSEGKIISMAEEYMQAVSKKEMGDWNWSAYKTSKAFINAWERFVLKRSLKEGQTCVSMHPGWCSTDMGGPTATSTATEGASQINACLWLKEIIPDRFYNLKFCQYMTCQ